jgi:hypothetical protein
MEADGIRPPFFEALTDALTGRSRLSYGPCAKPWDVGLLVSVWGDHVTRSPRAAKLLGLVKP